MTFITSHFMDGHERSTKMDTRETIVDNIINCIESTADEFRNAGIDSNTAVIYACKCIIGICEIYQYEGRR